MKRTSCKFLPWLCAGLGGAALILRFFLYRLENQSGLLPHAHPLHIAALILAAAAAVVTAVCTLRLKGSGDYAANFPFSRPRAQGSFLAGLLMFPVATGIWADAADKIDVIWAVLAVGACVCLFATGYFQLKGQKPHFALYAVICLFFAFNMVCKYRGWSGNPQVEDYVFALPACIFLAIFAYNKTAFSVGTGKRRMLLFSGLMAVFFCICSLVGDGSARFYAAGGIWAVSNLGVIDPPEA